MFDACYGYMSPICENDEKCVCQVARDVWNGLCNLKLMQTLVSAQSLMVCMGMMGDVFNETLHQKNVA